MQLTSQEEYGLRCLLTVTRDDSGRPVGISEIAAQEGLSPEYTAKLMRVLRQGGLVVSTRGAAGGYQLSRSPEEISVWSVIEVLGGPLFGESFCHHHRGQRHDCVHSISANGCSIRAMWQWVGNTVRGALQELTLAELIRPEAAVAARLYRLPRPLKMASIAKES